MSDPVVVSLNRTPEAQERRQRAQQALEAFFAGKPAGPLPRTVWLGEGYIEASVFNNRLHLSAVFVMPDKRNAKLGTAYLQEFLAVADAHQVEVECTTDPFGSGGIRMSVADLTRWYKKHGFASVDGRRRFLVRPVQQALAA